MVSEEAIVSSLLSVHSETHLDASMYILTRVSEDENFVIMNVQESMKARETNEETIKLCKSTLESNGVQHDYVHFLINNRKAYRRNKQGERGCCHKVKWVI